MNNKPERSDELNDLLMPLEKEFQRRGDQPGLPPPSPVPGMVTPLAPAQTRVQLSIPTYRVQVVYGLIAVNVIMYVATMLVAQRVRLPYRDAFFRAGATPDAAFSVALYILGAKWGPAIVGGQTWRLFTPMILHGSLIHLAFNSYALYVLGPQTERVYGTARFLALYLLAGVAGNIASFAVFPTTLAIGASGAIFGLIGALAAWSYASRSLIGAEASSQQIRQLVGLAAVNLILGFTLANIDNSAHVGGLVAGALVGLALAPRYTVDERVFPPIIVPGRRGWFGWLAVVALLIVLVVIAEVAIRRMT
ncbi:MAG: rhomboid family intramembrane serine protease [Herpetosiphon sp.]